MTRKNRLDDKKVLIVDDERDILDTLEDLLPMCHIRKTLDFDEAKTLLDTETFDIAILDIMGVNGYVLLDIAREKGITAIMLTAHALSPENVDKSYRKGAAFFIPKVKMVEIETFLEDVLEAQEIGSDTWERWRYRLGAYFESKFGPGWKPKQREIWKNDK